MLRIFLGALLVLLFATGAQAERRVALVLANDDYRIVRPLKNAVNDSHTVEAVLEKLGFDVTEETNRDLKRMRRALDDFKEDAAGADVALVYYSGHGVEIAGDNRLLPTDADPSSLDRLKQTTLPLEDVRDAVTSVAKVGLIVLDACRTDPFGQSEAGDGRGVVSIAPEVKAQVSPGLGRMGRAENVLFSFSAAPGETASDGANGNSDFSTALAKFLPTDGLEIRSVLTLVQQDVYDRSRGKQLPYIENGLPKLFFAASSNSTLPERDRLLLAMADVTPDLRNEVEAIAAKSDIPLAPLYAALITSDGKAMKPEERHRKLQDAATSFIKVRADMRNLASTDPDVTKLRQQAEAKLELGSFDEARSLLDQAVGIDAKSRKDLKANFIDRTLSEATTHYLSGGASLAQLRYDLALTDYQQAVDLYGELEGMKLPDDARYQQGVSWEKIGTTQMTLGNLPAAAKAYENMENAVEKRIEADPGNVDHKRDLFVARGMIADVKMAMGDVTGAIAMFEDSRKTLSEVFKAAPRPEYVRDMAVSYNRTGDARLSIGDGLGALADYKRSRRLMQRLVLLLPDDDGFHRDLGVSYSKMGQAYRVLDDRPAAIAQYSVALAITEALSQKSPDDKELQRDVTVNLNALGDIQRLLNDNADAILSFQRSVEVTQKLMEHDPSDTQLRRDLSVGLNKLGDAKLTSGDFVGALAQYNSAVALSEYLVGLDPTNFQWQRDLSVTHNKVGEVFLIQDNKTAAAKEFQAGFAIADAQLKADPGNVQRIVDAAFCRYKLAMAGVDPTANFTAAHDALTKLRDDGRLPGANSTWIAMVENGMKQAGSK